MPSLLLDIFTSTVQPAGLIEAQGNGNKSAQIKWNTELGSFSPKPPGQRQILWLNCDTFGMDGSQVSVFEEGNEVSLGSLLEGHNSG